LVFINVGAV